MSDEILPPPAAEPRAASVIKPIVASSVRHRFLVVLMALALVGAGVWSFGRLPVGKLQASR
jgi:multidrug efflux pump subunit AcrB